ncbi:hypothetical protein WN943_019911 [Citrus x changshan-huyou]
MAEKQLEILRGYELRLLRRTLAPSPSDLRIQSQPLNEESQCSLLPLHKHINSLIDSIESGHYLQLCPPTRLNLSSTRSTSSASTTEPSVPTRLLRAAPACRSCNVTGPLDDNSPKCRFPLEVSTLEGNELIEWENWARYQLMSVGSDLLGKFSYLQYIVFAKMLLMKTKDLLFDATVLPVNGIRTISWWLTKLLLMHQRILDQRSSCLYDLLKLHDIDPSEFVSTFHLEAGLLEHIYRRVDSCRKHFESAEMAADPQLSVTGVLGFRTVHQVEPKAQMVLVANTSSSNTSDVCPSINQVIHTHDSTIGVDAAMALNSLYPDGWFALGAAALKARDVEKALDGFTRAVQFDPDNGEAWKNIACLHMIKKKSKEAFIAFKEALKFKRNSWQLWENYGHVALDVGNIGQALEAVQMVLNMTNDKRIDTELLERIVLDLEGRTSIIESESCRTTHNLNRTNNTCAKDLPVESVHVSSPEESIMGRSRENEHLMEFLGKILQQVVRSESSADMWGLCARWLKSKGDLTMCSEALLKQVRSYQGSDLWKDRDRFKRFSYASLELCKVYMEISSSSGSRRELFAAEMHLKNAEGFSDMEEFRDLQACLDEVKTKLQSGPVAT